MVHCKQVQEASFVRYRRRRGGYRRMRSLARVPMRRSAESSSCAPTIADYCTADYCFRHAIA